MIERIRSIGRSLLGYDSTLYRFASLSTDYLALLIREGPATWRAFQSVHTTATPVIASVQLGSLQHPISWRFTPHDWSM